MTQPVLTLDVSKELFHCFSLDCYGVFWDQEAHQSLHRGGACKFAKCLGENCGYCEIDKAIKANLEVNDKSKY